MSDSSIATLPNGARSQHQSEAVYSTLLSSALFLPSLNSYIHSISALPHPIEFIVFLCGYAFNPTIVPLWLIVSHLAGASHAPGVTVRHPNPYYAVLLYLTTVIITLVATEILKASFSSTRPEATLSCDFCEEAKLVRRYRTLVSSLKSKHSFPSGDSAQAANLCFYLWNYVPCEDACWPYHAFAFGLFLPGVCFARVFYHCHWVEDCVGGVALSAALHKFIIPVLAAAIGKNIDRILG